MKFPILFFYFFLNISSYYAQNQPIQFLQLSLAEALAKAKKENKLVFLDFTASWCMPCKAMDKEVFIVDKVGSLFNKKYISVKISTEDPAGKALAQKYNVYEIPTLLFLNYQGVVLMRSEGYMPPQELVKLSEQVSKINLTKVKEYADFTQNPSNPSYLLKYLEYLNTTDSESGQPVFEDYFAEVPKAALSSKENWIILKSYTKSTKSKAFNRVMDLRHEFNSKYGSVAIDSFILNTSQKEYTDLKISNASFLAKESLAKKIEQLQPQGYRFAANSIRADVALIKSEYDNYIVLLDKMYFDDRPQTMVAQAWLDELMTKYLNVLDKKLSNSSQITIQKWFDRLKTKPENINHISWISTFLQKKQDKHATNLIEAEIAKNNKIQRSNCETWAYQTALTTSMPTKTNKGFRVETDSIVFEYNTADYLTLKGIKNDTLVASNNLWTPKNVYIKTNLSNWNIKDPAWQLQPLPNKTIWQLKKHKKDLADMKFLYIVDQKYQVVIDDCTLNTSLGENAEKNLIIKDII